MKKQQINKRKKLLFEKLEDRIYYSAAPVVAVHTAGENQKHSAVVNENVQVTVSMSNTGQDAGKAPFVNIFVPKGIDASKAQASLLGMPADITHVQYDATGKPNVTVDPVTKKAIPTDPTRANGTLLIAKLPIDALKANQGQADVVFSNLKIINDITLVNNPLKVVAVGGFAQGDTAQSVPITSDPTTDVINPTLLKVTTTSNLPEGETASGSNFNYTVKIGISDGQKLDNLMLNDYLPVDYELNGLYVSGAQGTYNVSLNGKPLELPYSGVDTPISKDSHLSLDFGSVEGTSAEDDILITLTGHYVNVNLLDSKGYDNSVSAKALFNGNEITDTNNVSTESKPLAIQSSAEVLSSDGLKVKNFAEPGDIVKYTIDFQVSDLLGLYGLQIQDLVGKGQSLLLGGVFDPTLLVKGQGDILVNSKFGNDNFNFTPNGPNLGGSLKFDLSNELKFFGADGSFLGGLYNGNSSGPSEGKIVFYTKLTNDLDPQTLGGTTINTFENKAAISGAVLGADLMPIVIGDSTNLSVNYDPISNTQVAEPDLQVVKTEAISGTGSNGGDAGDTVTYTITVSHKSDSAANAYNIGLVDSIPTAITGLAVSGKIMNGSTLVSTIPSSSFSISGGNVLTIVGDIDLPKGKSLVITVTGKVAQSIQPGQTVSNTASITYSDSNYTKYSSGCNIFSATSATVSFTAPKPSIVKEIQTTSVNNDTNTNVYIGEIVTYKLTIKVPEGTIRDGMDIFDALPTGMEFVSGSASINLTGFAGNAGSVVVGSSTFSTGTHAIPASIISGGIGNGSDFTIHLGKIINTKDQNTGDDTFTITYQARILNVSTNKDGTKLQNNASTSIDNPNSSNSSDIITSTAVGPKVCVVEPDVEIEKHITKINGTTVSGDDIPAFTGDTITYAITLKNVGDAKAFDLTLKDVLPAGVTFASLVGTNPSANPAVTASINGQTITFNHIPDLAAGASFVITLTATVNASNKIGDKICNDNVVVDFDSLTSNCAPFERSYEHNLASSSTDCDQEDQCIVIQNSGKYELTKTVIATSEASTGTSKLDPNITDLTIGETVTFEIVATFARGSTTNVVISDLLSDVNADLSITEATVFSIGGVTTANAASGGNLTFSGNLLKVGSSGTLSDTDADSDKDKADFNFATVINSGASSDASKSQIVLHVKALVLNVNANMQGDKVENDAKFVFKVNNQQQEKDASAKVELVEPNLQIEKHITKINGSDVSGDDLPAFAGDTITYAITVKNFGLATAFDSVLQDILPAGITFAGDVTGASSTNVNGQTVDFTIGSIAPDQTFVITFNAIIGADVPAKTELCNNCVDVKYDTIPGETNKNERNYDHTLDGSTIDHDSEDQCVVIKSNGQYSITKSVFSTSEPSTGTAQLDPSLTDLTIGESVTFELIATFAHGSANNVIISDSMANQLGVLAITGASIISVGSSITGATLNPAPVFSNTDSNPANDTVAFSFGNISNSGDGSATATNQIKIRVTAIVLNDNANQQGDKITDTAKLKFNNDTRTDTKQVELVEPNLQIEKHIIKINGSDVSGDDLPAFAGDTITYQITVQNLGKATAFDAVLRDVLPAGISFDDSVKPVSITATVNSQTIDFALGSINPNQTLVITFNAKIDENVIAKTELCNDCVDVKYDTIPGESNNNERNYDHTLDASTIDFNSEDQCVRIVDNGKYAIDKSIFCTSDPNTGTMNFQPTVTDLTIGEVVTYQLVATFAHGTASNVVILDSISNANGILEIIDAQIVSEGSNLNIQTPHPSPVINNNNNINSSNTVSFSFGKIVNSGSGAMTSPNQIVILVSAVVKNIPANMDGDVITDIGKLLFNNDTRTDSEQVEIVEPKVVGDKKITAVNGSNLQNPSDGSDIHVDAGDSLTYTITVNNAAPSHAPAYNIAVVDQLETDMSFGAGAVVAKIVNADNTFTTLPSNYFSISGSNLLTTTSNANIDLLVGQKLVITVTGTLKQSVQAGENLCNKATIGWTTVNGDLKCTTSDNDGISQRQQGGTEVNCFCGDSEHTGKESESRDGSLTTNVVKFQVAKPTVDKSIFATSESFTSGDDVAIGEVVTYHLAITVPEGTIPDGMVIKDALPTGLSFVAGSAIYIVNGFNGTVNNAGTNTAYTNNQAIDPADISFSGGLLTINLGKIVNSADNNVGNNTFIIAYKGLVQNIVSNHGLNNNKTVLTNNVFVQVENPNYNLPENDPCRDHSASVYDSNHDSTTVEVVEPDLKIEKHIVSINGDEVHGDDPNASAGDVVKFKFTISHTNLSNTDAFDLDLKDILPAEFLYQSGSLNVSTGQSVTFSQIGQTIHFKFDKLVLGDTIMLSFDVKISGEVEDGQTICNDDKDNPNDDSEVTYDSLPADNDPNERDYEATLFNNINPDKDDKNPEDQCVDIINKGKYELTKEVIATCDPNTESNFGNPNIVDLTIGETVTFEIVATFKAGSTNNVIITDLIDDMNGELSIMNAHVSSIGSNLTTQFLNAGSNGSLSDPDNDNDMDKASFNFGKVTNSGVSNNPAANQIKILVTAVVLNVIENQQGDVIRDNAKFEFNHDHLDAHANVEIVEPQLQAVKSVNVSGAGDAGDNITYTVTVSHTGSSEAPAYDIEFIDDLPSEITNISFTAFIGITDVTNQFEIAGGVLTTKASANVDLLLGQQLVVTVHAQLASDVQPGQNICNEACVTWTSINGKPGDSAGHHDGSVAQIFVGSDQSQNNHEDCDPANERSGSCDNPTDALNKYVSESNNVMFSVPKPSVEKTLIAASTDNNADTLVSDNVVIGETVTYDLAITIPDSIIHNGSIDGAGMVITDLLSTGLKYQNGTAQIFLTDFGVGSSVQDTANNPAYTNGDFIANADVSISGQTLTIKLGNIVSSSISAGPHILHIQYTALVQNIASNQSGTTLDNDATIKVDNPNDDLPETDPCFDDSTDHFESSSQGPTLTVIEPKLDITKTVTTNDPDDVVPVVDVGDNVVYDIKIQHNLTSQTGAFDLNIDDIIPSAIGSPIIFSVTSTNGYTASDFEIVNISGVNHLREKATSVISLPSTTDTLEIVIHGILNVTPFTPIQNTVDVTWTSLDDGKTTNDDGAHNDDGERTGNELTDISNTIDDYFSTSSAIIRPDVESLLPSDVIVDKTIIHTSEPNTTPDSGSAVDGAIGEIVTYQVTINFNVTSTAFTASMIVRDTLPVGLSYFGTPKIDLSGFTGNIFGATSSVNYAALISPATIDPSDITATTLGDGVPVFFNFKNVAIEPGSSIVITYQALVDNVLSSRRDKTLPNAVDVAISGVDQVPGDIPVQNNPVVTIVEPTLTIAKTGTEIDSSGNGVIDAGDTVFYTITVKHTPESNEDAFNIKVNDVIPSSLINLSLVSAKINGSTDVSGQLNLNNNTLSTPGTIDLPLGDVLVIQIKGTIAPTVTGVVNITNNVNVVWQSIDSTHSNANFARDGSGQSSDPSVLNNYFSQATNTFVTAVPLSEFLPLTNPFESAFVEPDSILPLLITQQPIFSGEATPGSTLVVEVYDENGILVSSITTVTDDGGNWLARFPVLNRTPQAVRITQVNPTYSTEGLGVQSHRTYYSISQDAQIPHEHEITTDGVMNDTPAREMLKLYEASGDPATTDWNEEAFKLFKPAGQGNNNQ